MLVDTVLPQAAESKAEAIAVEFYERGRADQRSDSARHAAATRAKQDHVVPATNRDLVPQPEACDRHWDDPASGWRAVCVRGWFENRTRLPGAISYAETYMALAWLADPATALIEPFSLSALAEVVGYHKSIAGRHVNALVDAGQVRWERAKGSGPGWLLVPDYLTYMRLHGKVLDAWAERIERGDVVFEERITRIAERTTIIEKGIEVATRSARIAISKPHRG